MRMKAIWKARHEWALGPLRLDLRAGGGEVQAAVPRSLFGDLTVDALLRHHLVHEAEAPHRLGVADEEVQAVGQLRLHELRLVDGSVCLVAQVHGQRFRGPALSLQPAGIPVDDRAQPGLDPGL
jgi:hypothetical protein